MGRNTGYQGLFRRPPAAKRAKIEDMFQKPEKTLRGCAMINLLACLWVLLGIIVAILIVLFIKGVTILPGVETVFLLRFFTGLLVFVFALWLAGRLISRRQAADRTSADL